MSGKTKVLHIVKYFYAGGAERLLSDLLAHSDKNRFEHSVLSLSNRNERIGDDARELGMRFKAVNMARGKRNIAAKIQSLYFAGRIKPDVIKSWLPPSNMVGGKLGRRMGVPVIWGIHDAQESTMNTSLERAQLALSHLPEKILCCSIPAYNRCVRIGYPQEKLATIVNGTDTDAFRPDATAGAALREKLGIGADATLIGMAAEFAPVKRHRYFLEAAAVFATSQPGAKFLLCGKDTDSKAARALVAELGLENHVHLLGIRNDMPAVYAALDVTALASASESFGLAVTEAMACGTPCVVTDVGMMKELLDGAGTIIPVCDDPHVLAAAWLQSLQLPGAEKASRLEHGRKRIIEHYSIRETSARYDALYAEVAALKRK